MIECSRTIANIYWRQFRQSNIHGIVIYKRTMMI